MQNQETTNFSHDNLPQAVAKVYNVVSLINTQLAELIKSYEPKSPSEYLTRDEVRDMLKCDQSTVHNWTIKGKLKKHCIGHRTYYKRSEVEAAIKPI